MIMRRLFKVEKIPLDTLINLLIDLYDSGIDYIDLSSNNDDPAQDKLIIQTKNDYINPDFKDRTVYNREEGDDSDDDDEDDDNIPEKLPPTIETKRLTDEDLNQLL